MSRNPSLIVKSPLEAIDSADVVFLATPFGAIESALTPLKTVLNGKILVDCTNPVGANLSHGLQSQISGSETIQQLLPDTQVVKAFTIYGYENFEDNHYPGYGDLKPAMLIAGNDTAAKKVVADLSGQLGWETVDTGNLSMSLHLEHMTLLWIKMARVQGQGAGFVWAKLKR
jgi:8-hydroxy-5-deazaflavin:NADPH oxidoreductase